MYDGKVKGCMKGSPTTVAIGKFVRTPKPALN